MTSLVTVKKEIEKVKQKVQIKPKKHMIIWVHKGLYVPFPGKEDNAPRKIIDRKEMVGIKVEVRK